MTNTSDKDNLTILAEYERVDIRRDKKYGKKCKLTAFVPPIQKDERHNSVDAFHLFREHVLAAYPKAYVGAGYDVRSSWQACLTYWLPASKPTLIVNDTIVRKALPSDDEFRAVISHCRDTAEQEFKKQTKQKEVERQTGNLLCWFSKEVEDDAKKNMRWVQRQAALLAELQAEVTAICASKLEEALKLLAEDQKDRAEKHLEGTHGYDPAAVELFKANALGYVADHKPEGHRIHSRFSTECSAEEWLAKRR